MRYKSRFSARDSMVVAGVSTFLTGQPPNASSIVRVVSAATARRNWHE